MLFPIHTHQGARWPSAFVPTTVRAHGLSSVRTATRRMPSCLTCCRLMLYVSSPFDGSSQASPGLVKSVRARGLGKWIIPEEWHACACTTYEVYVCAECVWALVSPLDPIRWPVESQKPHWTGGCRCWRRMAGGMTRTVPGRSSCPAVPAWLVCPGCPAWMACSVAGWWRINPSRARGSPRAACDWSRMSQVLAPCHLSPLLACEVSQKCW